MDSSEVSSDLLIAVAISPRLNHLSTSSVPGSTSDTEQKPWNQIERRTFLHRKRHRDLGMNAAADFNLENVIRGHLSRFGPRRFRGFHHTTLAIVQMRGSPYQTLHLVQLLENGE